MDTFFRFLYEFLMQFFSGVQLMLTGILGGVKQAFNIKNYVKVVNFYKKDFSGLHVSGTRVCFTSPFHGINYWEIVSPSKYVNCEASLWKT